MGPAELGSFPTAIVNGRVLTMTGPPLERATVLIQDGRIRAVEPSADVPDDAHILDARGKWVLPGLVDSHAHVGLQEDVSEAPGDDLNETSSPDTSGLRVIDGIDIEDSAFRDALSGGITTVVVLPGSANPLSGESAALKTWGGRTVDEQIVRAPLGLKSGFGENPKATHGGAGRMPTTRLGTALIVRQAMEEARSYRAAREAGEQSLRDLRLEALTRLLDGETSWAVHAHRHDDIVTAIRIADEFGLRLIVNHGTSAQRIVDVLAERDLPVLVGPLVTARTKLELAEHSGATPGVLHKAGVRFALTTDHPVVPVYLLVLQAALAVKHGLPHDASLHALTAWPASILGLEDRIGSLRPGADADVVIWSGDPLNLDNRVEAVLIDGRLVYTWDPESRDGTVWERTSRFRPGLLQR